MSNQPDLIEQIMEVCWDIANDPGGRMFNGGDEATRAELAELLAQPGRADPAVADGSWNELSNQPGLDLEAITREWLKQCGPCDYGMVEYGCAHPDGDYRPVMMSLVREVERLRADAEAHSRLWQQRDEAIAERDRLRPVVEAARAWRDVFTGPDEAMPDGYYAAFERDLAAAVDAYNAQPKATGGVIDPGTVMLVDDGCVFPDAGRLTEGSLKLVVDTTWPLRDVEVAPTFEDEPHRYLSTACFHGHHDYCAGRVRQDGGQKIPSRCKFCPSPCTCDCHRKEHGT